MLLMLTLLLAIALPIPSTYSSAGSAYQAVGAAGQVVDEHGNGIAGARVAISTLHQRDPLAPAHATRRMTSWLRTTSRADGSFIVYVQDPGSIPDPATLVATASHAKLTTLHPVPVKPGATDLRLELRTGARVRVDTRLVEAGWVQEASFQLVNLDVGHSSGIFRRGKEHTLHSVRPGRYLLTARLIDGTDSSTVVIGNEIIVRPGEICEDPLHNPVRIEAYVLRHEFEVELADGTRPTWIEFGTKHRDQWGTNSLRRKGKRFKVTTSIKQETFRCCFQAKGTRRLYLESLPEDGVVRLSKGISAKIRLVGAPTLDDAASQRHQPLIQTNYGSPHGSYLQTFTFNRHGEAELLVPFAGEFQLLIPTPGMSATEAADGFGPWTYAAVRIPEEGGIVDVVRVKER